MPAGEARSDLESGAQISQLDALLFAYFHVDHSGDFAALIKSSWFEDRKRPLPIYGPTGNDFMPSTTEFVSDFFGEKHRAYRYLSELLEPDEEGSYKIQPHNIAANQTPAAAFRSGDLAVSGVRVIHGAVPALAWRVEIGGKVVVFSGDTNGEGEGLVQLAMNADLFIAHNAVPEGAVGIETVAHAAVGDRTDRRRSPCQALDFVSSHVADTREGGSDRIRDKKEIPRPNRVCKRPRLLPVR